MPFFEQSNDYQKRTPRWIRNLLLPRLSASEQACLNFLLVHSFSEYEKDEPLAFDFFTQGSKAGDIVFNLGTGLSKNTTKSSLARLKELGLIKSYVKCKPVFKKSGLTGCGWIGKPVLVCPNCNNKNLTDCFVINTITPGLVIRVLSATEEQNRKWSYNPELEVFFVSESQPQIIQKNLKEEISVAQSKVQYPDLLEEMVKQATQHNKTNVLADSRYLKGFLHPMLALQEEFSQSAVEYALKRTIEKKITSSSNVRKTWLPYARACAKGYLEKNYSTHKKVTQAVDREKISGLLAQCAELNYDDEFDKALQIFLNLKKNHLQDVVQLLDSDETKATENLDEAFKKGIDDFEDPFFYTTGNEFEIPEA